jgi:DinB family protein
MQWRLPPRPRRTIAGMSDADVFSRAFEAVQRRFTQTLEGIAPEQLSLRPHPEANSIAWLGWHLTRWQDAQLSRFAGRDQAWLAGWAAKFGREADPDDTGIGHSSEQVAQLRAEAQLLLGYHDAVCGRTRDFLATANEADLAREVESPRGPDTVAGRLVGVLSDNFQHVGQMAYLRGLHAGAHWGAH